MKFMIEIIYNESGKHNNKVIVKPPKNIRQIGNPRGRHKIYMEDYVYTFLHSSTFEGNRQKRAAVLLGKSEVAQDIRYTFISGAVSCEDFIFQEDGIVFDESCWEYIYKEIKEYFDSQEIVGWFMELTGYSLELTPAMEAAHRKYFVGREKVLFLSEPSEGEDVFFSYEQGVLQKKEGYYIYYEKNIPMQEYMVCTRERHREQEGGIEAHIPELAEIVRESPLRTGDLDMSFSEETYVDDSLREEEKPAVEEMEKKQRTEQAIRNYRNKLVGKKTESRQRKTSVLLHTTVAAAMVLLCVIGITTLNNYERMQQVEQTLANISVESGDDLHNNAQNQELHIESLPSEVTPEEDTSGQDPENGQDSENMAEATESGQAESGVDENMPGEAVGNDDQNTAENAQGAGDDGQNGENSDNDQPDVQQTAAQNYLEQGFYVVQPGDKLETICRNIYQTTAMMDKLCEVNQITDKDKIYAGQKLMLP